MAADSQPECIRWRAIGAVKGKRAMVAMAEMATANRPSNSATAPRLKPERAESPTTASAIRSKRVTRFSSPAKRGRGTPKGWRGRDQA